MENNHQHNNLFVATKQHVLQERHSAQVRNRASISYDIHHNMALFDRNELVLGELVGKGAFCLVHALQDVCLNNGTVSPTFSRPWWDNTLHQADRTREYVRQTCRERNSEEGRDEGDAAKISMIRPPRIVVKHLRPNLATERSYKVFCHAAADLRMEYEILSRLSHPNIVQLRGGAAIATAGCGSWSLLPPMEEECYFLLLERLDETLSRRIHCWKRLASLPQKQYCDECTPDQPSYLEKLRFARDLASALSYIHDQRLIFRDLKPDNCAISYDGTIKLIDFGLCRELPRVSEEECLNGKEPLFRMSCVGTRRYMAPEMIVGRGYNQKIDCYSWAMILYEMITLQKPFATYDRYMHKVLVCENADRPELSLKLPLSARNLLHRAWAQQPWDRPPMVEICSELENMIECAERQTLTEHERSLKVVMEMAELFCIDDDPYHCNKKDDSFVSRKSMAERTVSTSTIACSDALEVTHSKEEVHL
jgi:serine/threonine protein kinase